MGTNPTPSRPPPATKHRTIKSVAHRFAAGCGHSVADLLLIGVRYDDDNPDDGDTSILRQRPGRLETIATISGLARAIAGGGDDVVVLDHLGVLRSVTGEHVLEGVLDLFESCAPTRELLALLNNGDVLNVSTHARRCTVAGGRSLRGGVVVTAEGVFALDGSKLFAGVVDVACAAGDRFAWACGRNLVVDGRPFTLRHPAQALCFAFGRCYVGSKINGLSVVDDEGLSCLRPSMRAHSLCMVNDGLLVVSDLMVATLNDGGDFVTRDLTTFIRLTARHE